MDFDGVKQPALIPHLPTFSIPISLFTLTSPTLGLLLVFRTNACYARWDDSRKIWGDIITPCPRPRPRPRPRPKAHRAIAPANGNGEVELRPPIDDTGYTTATPATAAARVTAVSIVPLSGAPLPHTRGDDMYAQHPEHRIPDERGSRAISAPCAACPLLRPPRCIELLHQTADARNRTCRAQVLRHARCTTSKMRVKPRRVGTAFSQVPAAAGSARLRAQFQMSSERDCKEC